MRSPFLVGVWFLATGCSCTPLPPAPDASFDSAGDDVAGNDAAAGDSGVDASDASALDAFSTDVPVGDILCTGMPVPRGLPCEAQDATSASGCGGVGRVAYHRGTGSCRQVSGAECGPVRGAFNTLEECAMACGRVGVSRYPAEFYPNRTGGENERRLGPLDFSVSCEAILSEGLWFYEGSRCAHLGLLAPLNAGASSVTVPATMSNQDVWELLNAAYLLEVPPGVGVLCAAPR